MEKKIADSIIIKVGQGIMAIPRNVDKLKKTQESAEKEENLTTVQKNKTQ